MHYQAQILCQHVVHSSLPGPRAHAGMSRISRDRGAILGEPGCSGSNESSSRTLCAGVDNELGNTSMPIRVTPDFAQVYNFLGSVFDPNTSGHSQRLKNMDPINVETPLLSMRNLAINLTSPEFEDHRQLLAFYDVLPGKRKAFDGIMHTGVHQSATST